MFNYRFAYNKLCTSIIFSYILSFIIHILIVIIIMIYSFYYVKKSIFIKKIKTTTFSLYQTDSFLYESLEKQNPLDIKSIVINTKKKLKSKLDQEKMDKNLDDSTKNISNFNTSSSVDVVKQCLIDSTTFKTDISIASKNKKNMCHKECEVIPCVIKRIYPKYPSHARILGIEGKLIVMYDVNNFGKIKNIRILSANPIGVFEGSVRSAMRRWIYENNKSKKDLTIIFRFYLNTIEIFDDRKNK